MIGQSVEAAYDADGEGHQALGKLDSGARLVAASAAMHRRLRPPCSASAAVRGFGRHAQAPQPRLPGLNKRLPGWNNMCSYA